MRRTIHFLLNDSLEQVELPSGLAVLDLLRRERRLMGTREGCREGDCGACLVLLGDPEGGAVRYRAVNSCLLPVGELENRHLVTIEGLNPPGADGPELNPLQRCFVEEGAIQCGFCTPGFIVALTGYFLAETEPCAEGAREAAAGNLCRCTGYASIRRAVDRLLEEYRALPAGGPLEHCLAWGVVPAWFGEAPARLAALRTVAGVQPGRPAAAASPPEPGAPAVLVAGGTDLFVQKAEELEGAELDFLSGRDLARTWVEGGRRFLGAALPMEDLRRGAGVSPFVDCLPCVASLPVRNRATIGGNIVNASPIGDFTIMLLALGATIAVRGPGGRRELPLEDFYKGYKKLDLGEQEVVEWVAFPEGPEGRRFHFEKVGRRQHLDIAGVNSAACLTLRGPLVQQARLAAGGVAPVPLLLRRASAFLSGREPTPETLRAVLRLAQEEAAPISDVRGSADYKRRLLKHLLLAHFLALLPQRLSAEAVAAEVLS